MEKNWKKLESKTLTIRVTNKVCGREDLHKNLGYEDLLWIAANPNLEIEILEAY